MKHELQKAIIENEINTDSWQDTQYYMIKSVINCIKLTF